MSRRRRKPVWDEHNLLSSEGVEQLERRDSGQQGPWSVVDPQPKVMIVIIDEADPHANQRDSYSGQYGVLYVLRTDDVRDKDGFWFQPPGGQRFRWGIVGDARWNIDHSLSGTNYGVKQFRIRRGG
jgi:hypothetical protein